MPAEYRSVTLAREPLRARAWRESCLQPQAGGGYEDPAARSQPSALAPSLAGPGARACSGLRLEVGTGSVLLEEKQCMLIENKGTMETSRPCGRARRGRGEVRPRELKLCVGWPSAGFRVKLGATDSPLPSPWCPCRTPRPDTPPVRGQRSVAKECHLQAPGVPGTRSVKSDCPKRGGSHFAVSGGTAHSPPPSLPGSHLVLRQTQNAEAPARALGGRPGPFPLRLRSDSGAAASR